MTLRFLLNTFARGRELPRTQAELYLTGCQILCEESNDSRRRSRLIRPTLDPSQRLAVAARIAAAVVCCGRPAIWTEPDRGDVPDGDLTVTELTAGRGVQTGDGTHGVTEAAVREVLDTALFSSRGVWRLGFAHHTYAEFLAAHYLHERDLQPAQIASILLHPDDPFGRVVPQLHETVAWLAGMDRTVFRMILRGDPQVLLQSDVAIFDAEGSRVLVDALLRGFDDGRLTDSDWDLRAHYSKLDHPGLGNQIAPYIQDRGRPDISRRFATDVARICRVASVQAALADVVLDPDDDLRVRVRAAFAVSEIGDVATRLRLRPCLTGSVGPDPESELKGLALRALWPGLITTSEMLGLISLSIGPSFGGTYSSFLYGRFPEQVPPEDLPMALVWLSNQDAGNENRAEVDTLADVLVSRALDHLDREAVCEALARLLTARMSKYRPILGTFAAGRALSISRDASLRHRLVLSLLPRLIERRVQLGVLFHSQPALLTPDDLEWLLERMDDDKSRISADVWALLIRLGYAPDPRYAESILGAAERHEALERECRDLFQAVELESDLARSQREEYVQMRRWQDPRTLPPVGPRPAELVERLLSACEGGDPGSWWRLNVVLACTPDADRPGNEDEADLTEMPGWNTVDAATRSRIIRTAEPYLRTEAEIDTGWIGGHCDNRPTMAGYRALRLLAKEEAGALEGLDDDTWKRWVPAVLGFPGAKARQADDTHRLILLAGFRRVPERFRELVVRMIESDSPGDYYLDHLDRVLSICWDGQLAAVLTAKVCEKQLAPPWVRLLLKALLERGVSDAESLSRSLVGFPLPGEEPMRSRSFAAIRAQIEAARDGGWSVLEPLMQEDPTSADQLFESLAWRHDDNRFASRLSEERLAAVYSWLVNRFPHNEDPHETGFDKLTERMQIGRLRDAILRHLQYRGTPEAQQAVEQLASALPQLPWLRQVAVEAADARLRQTWRRPSPADLLLLITDPRRRLIETGSQLLDVLTESVARLEQDLQGETPLAPALWDEIRHGVFRPKHENWLSDFVVAHLRRDLAGHGVVVNREVEIRRGEGDGLGERTDIYVDAVLPGTNDRLTAVVEVKGCWHRELCGAMQTQLRDRYLRDSRCRHGLYLVGWYVCPQWEGTHLSSRRPPFSGLDDLRTFLEEQAHQLSSAGLTIRSCSLNATLR